MGDGGCISKLFHLVKPAGQSTPLWQIPPRASKRTKATFPWGQPVLPPATAPKTSLKPPPKVTFSCGDSRNSPTGHVCVPALLSQRTTPLIAALLQSFDICGKNMLFQPQQPSALPGSQQVLSCCLSPALLLLTEDQTELCHLCNPARPCSCTQPLPTALSDPASEMTQKPGNLGENGQKPRLGLYLLLSDMQELPLRLLKAKFPALMHWGGHPDPETSDIILVPHGSCGFAVCDIVLPAKLRGFPYNSLRDIKSWIEELSLLSFRVSVQRVS